MKETYTLSYITENGMPAVDTIVVDTRTSAFAQILIHMEENSISLDKVTCLVKNTPDLKEVLINYAKNTTL